METASIVIARWLGKARFENLKAALHDIASDVESLVTIGVNGTTFEVEYYLGGDWKFLALATGIDSASSKYACTYLVQMSGTRASHLGEKWSMLDPTLEARSIEGNIWFASSRSKQFNVSRLPIFPTIRWTK